MVRQGRADGREGPTRQIGRHFAVFAGRNPFLPQPRTYGPRVWPWLLAPRLAVFETTAQIGVGVDQVYRATDTKLKRQVAINLTMPYGRILTYFCRFLGLGSPP